MSLLDPEHSPKPFINALVGKKTYVKTKWDLAYKGTLISVDRYMNLQLGDIEEYKDGAYKGVIKGEMLLRCNNVLYVKEADE